MGEGEPMDNIDEVYVYCSNPAVKPYLPEGVKFLQRDERLDQFMN